MQSFHPLMRMLSYFILGVSGLTLAQVLSKQASWQLLTVAFIKSLTWLWLRDLTIIACIFAAAAEKIMASETSKWHFAPSTVKSFNKLIIASN